MSPPITLVGSGLAGTLLALHLAQAGFEVTLFEKNLDLRKSVVPAGRSINLALSERGLYALETVGLKDPILNQAIPMRGRMMHDLTGQLTFQHYGKNENEYINSISRSQLNRLLIEAAEAQGVKIAFGQVCEDYDFPSKTLYLKDLATGQRYSHQTPVVIGCDGAGSALRKALIQRPRVNYTQSWLEYGYKELTIPATASGDFQLEKNALHIWPRNTFMLIALPNLDGSFTCTLFYPFEGPQSFAQLTTPEAVAQFFAEVFPDALSLIPNLTRDFFNHPTGPLATVYCDPWHVEGQFLLLGDAAHAIVPFFGQGMNAAFEDCTYLLAAIHEGGDWAEVFARFYQQRKADADAIAQMALENFIEMRDSVADPQFLLKKQVSLLLEERFNHYISKYAMVSFHRIPYALALKHGELQQALLNKICAQLNDISELNLDHFEPLVQAYLTEAPPFSTETKPPNF